MAGETLLTFIQNMTTAHLEKQTLLCPFVAPMDRQTFLSYLFAVFDSMNKIKAIRWEKVSEQQNVDFSRRSMSSLTEELQTLLNSIHTSISMYLPHLSLCFPLHAHISNFSFILLPYLLLHYFIFLSFSFFLSPSCSLYLSDSFLFFILSVFFISSHLLSKCALFSFPLLTFSLYLSPVIFLQKCLF